MARISAIAKRSNSAPQFEQRREVRPQAGPSQ
jgi:hypothetical protein